MHAKAFEKYIKKIGFSKKDIDLIGFHGHTIMHRPPSRYKDPSTWQIGDGQLFTRKKQVSLLYTICAQTTLPMEAKAHRLSPFTSKHLLKALICPLPSSILVVFRTWHGLGQKIKCLPLIWGQAMPSLINGFFKKHKKNSMKMAHSPEKATCMIKSYRTL
ncbi:MAG: anhydro-N-acetylmuramic acid kinase [Holosporaceae bacterium]|nr:MAG: anhydro-N-acetylmuramic acid kinase [Holosporaceae bacterium]